MGREVNPSNFFEVVDCFEKVCEKFACEFDI